jgi:uncharacterized membrane protein
MRWLLLVLLISLAALLIAAAGGAHYIWALRRRSRSGHSARTSAAPGTAEDTDEDTEL